MTCLIVDANLTIKFLLPSEHHQQYIALFDQWKEGAYKLYAPTLWSYEVTSTLNKMIHFGLLSKENAQANLQLALQLGIDLIPPNDMLMRHALNWSQRLNRIVAYDSFYLALAEARQCELWTADKKLVNVVNQSWVKLAV